MERVYVIVEGGEKARARVSEFVAKLGAVQKAGPEPADASSETTWELGQAQILVRKAERMRGTTVSLARSISLSQKGSVVLALEHDPKDEGDWRSLLAYDPGYPIIVLEEPGDGLTKLENHLLVRAGLKDPGVAVPETVDDLARLAEALSRLSAIPRDHPMARLDASIHFKGREVQVEVFRPPTTTLASKSGKKLTETIEACLETFAKELKRRGGRIA